MVGGWLVLFCVGIVAVLLLVVFCGQIKKIQS